MKNHLNNQSGVALLTVLLLVVSITVVAGVMLVGQSMTTRKSSLLFEQDKLIHQLHAGEQLAKQIIITDNKLNQYDSLEDIWAEQISPYTTPEGYVIELEIRDSSAKFNLNNLYHDGEVDSHALASFQRLLRALDIDTALATTILDWQDPDSQVYNDTAEESSLYQSEKNTQVANQPFIEVAQLADLPNVTPEILAKLRPYVTAVPYWLPVNVNTADETVLMAIVGEENDSAVQTLITQRESQPISSQEGLKSLQLFANSEETTDEQSQQEKSPKQQTPPKKDGEDKKAKAGEEKVEEKGKENKDKQAKANKEKEVQQKLAILSVKSGAFEGLVTAKDSNNPPKTRYATFKIAKGKLSDPNANKQAQNQSKQKEDKVQVFASRMWAFRPVF